MCTRFSEPRPQYVSRPSRDADVETESTSLVSWPEARLNDYDAITADNTVNNTLEHATGSFHCNNYLGKTAGTDFSNKTHFDNLKKTKIVCLLKQCAPILTRWNYYSTDIVKKI